MSVQTGLLRDVSRRVLRRDAAEDHDIGNRVAAQTVRAMHAAGDFASRIQTRDRLARFGQHFSVRVDLQTAHRVMDARRNLDGVVRSGVQRGGEGQAAERVVLLIGDGLVPGFHGRGEGRRINAQLLGQRLVAVRLHSVALGEVAVVGGRSVHHLLVEDGILLSGVSVKRGGMVAALDSMVSPLVGAEVNISDLKRAYPSSDVVRILFSEVPGVIFQINDSDYDYLDAELLLQDVMYFPLGHPVRRKGKVGAILDSLIR